MHLLKWLYPGMKFKRWLLLFSAGVMLVSLGLALVFNYKYLDYIEEAIFRAVYLWRGSYNYTFSTLIGIVVVLIGVALMLLATKFVIRSVIMVLLPDNSERLVDIIYEKRKLGKGPNVTVVGGGHGLSVLLRGIKSATSNVTAVVTVADDGGSSGRLREELGIIPPGDLRNCLVALADTEPLMEKLFQYRFRGESELAGHSFGNLFIAAMNEVTGDVEQALKESSKVLAVKGQVLPASKDHVRLDAIMEDGTIVEGESHIPEVHKRIHRVRLFPEHVKPNYEGKKVLQIFSFCCIAAIVISMMTDIIISPGVHWSVFVAAGCLTMWFIMAVGYVKRYNLLKNAAWQLLIMSGICVLWDAGTGWRGWSVNIGIPNICLLIQVAMFIISRIRSLSPREYMIYYVMASVYSMVLPFILLMTGVIRYRTPTVVCIGCSFLFLIGLILFKRKEFKEEMHKKFHVG